MGTELEKMLAGELYDPMDPELVRARVRARDLCQDLNATRETQMDERRQLLKQLFGKGGDTVWMQPPFFCDYGFNFNCVVLDVCRVTIGDYTQFGPAVQVYTATHPMNADLRRRQEFVGARQLVRRRSQPALRDGRGSSRSGNVPSRRHASSSPF